MRMGTSGHSFFIYGGTALQSLIDGEIIDNNTGSFYTGSGMPVHIISWNLNDNATNEDYVSWSLTLTEDKDDINMTN